MLAADEVSANKSRALHRTATGFAKSSFQFESIELAKPSPQSAPYSWSGHELALTASGGERRGDAAAGQQHRAMQLCGLSNARPIPCSDCPAFQWPQTSPFSITERPIRFSGLIEHPFKEQTYVGWCCIDLSNAPCLPGTWQPGLVVSLSFSEMQNLG